MPNKQDRKTQRLFNNVTKSLLTQNNGLKRDSETGVLYEEPLKDEHPGLDLALMYAQPGNIVAKVFAPSMAKGLVEGIRNGDTEQAMLSMLFPEGNVAKSLIDLDKLGKTAKFTLSDPEKYWYVAHQTGSANFPKIMKSGLQTTNGLNGTALHLTEDYANMFGKGLLKKNHLSHEGADGMVIMKFPKSKFPSGDLDDISMRLMELGESKNFEVPTQYLTFVKKSQLKQGGIFNRYDTTEPETFTDFYRRLTGYTGKLWDKNGGKLNGMKKTR